MASTGSFVNRQSIITFALGFAVAAMLASCTFHEHLPVCHWLFGCDHQVHAAESR